MYLSILHKILRWSIGITLIGMISVMNVGCSDDVSNFVTPDNPEDGFINISLKCVESTRAEGDESYKEKDDRFNEDLISFVTVCLWPNDATLNDNESGQYAAKPYYVQKFNIGKNESAKVRIPLTAKLVKELFNTQKKCNVFVVANVEAPEGEFTIKDYRDKVIDSEFATEKLQANFAMDGDGEISLESGNALTQETFYAYGDVELKRSASKITLALNVEETVEQSVVVEGKLESSLWAPITGGMQVYLRGGLKQSTLDPKMDYITDSDLFFNTSIATETPYKFIENKESENPNGNNPGDYTYPFIQDAPFYSYPHVWTAEPDDYASTFMLLSIPWMQIETDDDGKAKTDETGKFIQKPGSSIRTCYYQVPAIAANSEKLQLVRNVSYHVYLHVGILGSFIPDEPLLLEDLQ